MSSVSSAGLERFRKGNLCPVCGGSEDDPRGQGVRCTGFRSGEGLYIHCSREEFGQGCRYFPKSETYSHIAKGPCKCGSEHSPGDYTANHQSQSPAPYRGTESRSSGQSASYIYRQADGTAAYLVKRYYKAGKKHFAQYRADANGDVITGDGRFTKGMTGVTRIPYRLDEFMEAIRDNRDVVVCEGEKDCDRAWSAGIPATTNSGGAGKWPDSFRPYFKGLRVAILADNDEPGREHAEAVAKSIKGLADSIKVVELPGLPEKGDVSDWLNSGGTAEDLKAIVAATPEWRPTADAKAIPSTIPIQERRLQLVGNDLGTSETDLASKPIIVISTKEHDVNDQAVEALAADETIFKRAFMLVTIQRTIPREDASDGKTRGIKMPSGSPRIAVLPTPRLRERLTIFADWVKLRKGPKGDEIHVPSHPPEWSVNAIVVRGEWPSIRELTAIVECPVLKPDGTILDKPGYDAATGILFAPNADYLPVKTEPSRADATAAADLLFGIVVDFPFANPAHKAAWLSAVITPLARFAFDEPTPLFLVDATQAGTGKSLLCDIVAIIRTGREMARKDYPDDNEEIRKTITAVALAGDPLMMFDNVDSRFGGSAIDAVLTAKTWKDRYLGRSEMTSDLPLQTIWFATGNNVALSGDIMRRIVPCRLESEVERPEEREGFKYPEVLDHVLENRPLYVQAAHTILRAYVVAGRPDQGLKPMGSYGKWSKVVRAAIHWATGIDPCQAREDLRASDDVAATVTSIVQGWSELPNARDGCKVSDALKELKERPDQYELLRQAFMSWSKNDDLPSPRIVGNRLKGMQGRVIGGHFMKATTNRDGVTVWSVCTVVSENKTFSGAGSAGSAGSYSSFRGKKLENTCNVIFSQDGGNQTPQTQQTPHESAAEDEWEVI